MKIYQTIFLGTIGKRLASINVENNEENRMKYRKLLFEAPAHVGEALGGCILFHETLYQKDNDGKLITDNLKERGIIRGIKVKSLSYLDTPDCLSAISRLPDS